LTISAKQHCLGIFSPAKILCIFVLVVINSHLVIAQETQDITAPVLKLVTLSPNNIVLNPASVELQEISLTLVVEDESQVRTNTFYLQNLANNEQIELIQEGAWQANNKKYTGTFLATIAPNNTAGIWHLSSLVLSDANNNRSDNYFTLEDLLIARLNPLISIAPSDAAVVFDARINASESFSQTGAAQTSYLDLTIQDAVEYEIWFVPEENTTFTGISFSGGLSIAQACSIFTRYAKCQVTSPNDNDEGFTQIEVRIDTLADDISSFGYSAFVLPNGQGYESEWLTNFVIFPPADLDGDGIVNEQDLDDDGDMVSDLLDVFPLDATETVDADGDGIGDNADTDDDNDGVRDELDAFPFNAAENNDNDNDGVGDNADTDDDNDGVIDSQDAFPFDASETIDTDSDGIGNNADNDDDNDGGTDDNDAFPLDPSETIDSDGDGIGNNADPDDDNDGVLDTNDAFSRDPTESIDTDQDGIGNNADPDDDNDGVPDALDEFPLDAGDSKDNDQDGIGDNADDDDDNDSVPDISDAFPFNANENADYDNDGIGDNADPDDDNDGLDDILDQFPKDASEVADFDKDGLGNNADTDDDNDGVLDVVDAFPFAVTEWYDTDGDGIGDNADIDNDNDGVDDEFDAFENDPLETMDFDNDNIGDNADLDDDNDGVPDTEDAFKFDASESLDTDKDGIGNNADTDDDGDRVLDDIDLFPLNSRESRDNDLDGIGDNSDTDDDNDTVLDSADAFPFDKNETNDNDLDGIGDNADTDDDNDGFADNADKFPFDATEWADNDEDLIGDNRDPDDDNDGVLDTQDAFAFDPSETLDNDNDGIGNNADEDDDNDGVLDSIDAFPFSAAESADSDGDGIGNNADSDDDNDGIVDEDDSQPLNSSIGDNESPTLDGINDLTIEAIGPLTPITLTLPRVRDNNLNPATLSNNYEGPFPLGEHVITWTAVDFAGNQSILNQKVVVQDTTPPVFSNLPALEIDSAGILTDVTSVVNETAFDLVDGNVSAVIITESKLKAGQKSVMLQAVDASGNAAIKELFLHILPAITAKPTGFTSVGARLQIPIVLSGKAPKYPVFVEYTVVGSVSSATFGILEIKQGQQGNLVIDVAQTANLGEQIWINFANPQNAIVGSLSQIRISVANINQSPVVNVKLLQNDRAMSRIYQDQGRATLVANISDVNLDDTHEVTWRIAPLHDRTSNVSVTGASNDNNNATIEFDPTSLPLGEYIAIANITESNTPERFSLAIEFTFSIGTTAPSLQTLTDSDFDGLSDSVEGFGDSDLDGIPDYLDDDENTSTLPSGASEQALTTLAGYRLTIGDIAKLSNIQNANSGIISKLDIEDFGLSAANPKVKVIDQHFDPVQQILNFNVENLDFVGQSVPVIIPLNTGTFIPSNAAYRKFNSRDGWFTFVVNAHNSILSSPFDANGNCPEADSSSYLLGLMPGDTCIQLLIQDGGPNDADLSANGIIKDPGVLSTGRPNRSPLISVTKQTTVLEGDNVRVDATLTTDVEDDKLLFTYTQIGGLRITLAENTSPLLSFNAPMVDRTETLLFRLDVFDGRDTASENVTVIIRNKNTAPSVTIEAHETNIEEATQLTLNSSAMDIDGDVLSYEWQQISGPLLTITGKNTQSVTFTMPQVTSEQKVTVAIFVFDGEKEVSALTTFTIVNKVMPSPSTNADSKGESGGGALGAYALLFVLLSALLRIKESKNLSNGFQSRQKKSRLRRKNMQINRFFLLPISHIINKQITNKQMRGNSK